MEEINKIRSDTGDWSKETRASAMQTREEANALLADAQRKHEAASQMHAEAAAKLNAVDGRVAEIKKQFRQAHEQLMGVVEGL